MSNLSNQKQKLKDQALSKSFGMEPTVQKKYNNKKKGSNEEIDQQRTSNESNRSAPMEKTTYNEA